MQINFKDFKDKVKNALLEKVSKRLEEIYESFSNNIFSEEFTNDEEYPNNIAYDNVQGPGGEFLVDLKFKDSNTKLKDFRVTAISKEDALSRLNNMFGKKSFKVTKIELEPNYDYKKTDKMLGRVVKESLSMNDSIKTWIDDFIASDNPRFKGKSKEERRQMAIAAYMSKKNELKESQNYELYKDRRGAYLPNTKVKVGSKVGEIYRIKHSEDNTNHQYDIHYEDGQHSKDVNHKKIKILESKKEDKKVGRKLKGIMTDPSYNATVPKNTSSFKSSETVSESCIINKILKNKKENGN